MSISDYCSRGSHGACTGIVKVTHPCSCGCHFPTPKRMFTPMPDLTSTTEQFSRLNEVTIPDWLESDVSKDELYALAVTIDTWSVIIDMIRRQLIKKAVLT